MNYWKSNESRKRKKEQKCIKTNIEGKTEKTELAEIAFLSRRLLDIATVSGLEHSAP